jgi:hypothetical protein
LALSILFATPLSKLKTEEVKMTKQKKSPWEHLHRLHAQYKELDMDELNDIIVHSQAQMFKYLEKVMETAWVDDAQSKKYSVLVGQYNDQWSAAMGAKREHQNILTAGNQRMLERGGITQEEIDWQMAYREKQDQLSLDRARSKLQ